MVNLPGVILLFRTRDAGGERKYLPYLFDYKPTLAISRDPKLVRHDSRRKLYEKNRKNIGYKPRPRFLHKKLLEHSFKKPSLSGNSHVESYCVE